MSLLIQLYLVCSGGGASGSSRPNTIFDKGTKVVHVKVFKIKNPSSDSKDDPFLFCPINISENFPNCITVDTSFWNYKV